jgi:hypothetical protein
MGPFWRKVQRLKEHMKIVIKVEAMGEIELAYRTVLWLSLLKTVMKL